MKGTNRTISGKQTYNIQTGLLLTEDLSFLELEQGGNIIIERGLFLKDINGLNKTIKGKNRL